MANSKSNMTGRKLVAASGIGGMKETQEMIDFAAKHNISPNIELITMDYVIMAKSQEVEDPVKAFGWAARDTSGVLSPFKFTRRTTGDHDVTFKVLYCGICHSDLHMVKNEWGVTLYPVLPGKVKAVKNASNSLLLINRVNYLDRYRHELVGIVTEIGSKVQKFKVGDKVGLGTTVESCRSCDNCAYDLENYCPKVVQTYNSIDYDGTTTYGGYSDIMVANEHFVVQWPENMALDAGKTDYETVFYLSMAAMGTMDGIIDTVSAVHPIVPLIGLLKTHGKLVMVGGPEKPLELPVFPLLMGRKLVAGSITGGMKETQEMIDFAAKHNITPNIELIPMDYVNTAMERLAKADVRYRFVIDIRSTLNAP
ncbi:hypothetical protein RJ639_006188 [Escallonia herrerae]|uniref:Uncharacterized protein n=1 Tax=Escallonia herrerae TaxID=1293975 RepID=A0AA88VVT3_9ASTE|nr:hypothetical protein RJ639_006188 [Escallonia herrerae]